MKRKYTSLLLACLMLSVQAWAELTQINGIYQIGTAAELQDFAAAVNGGETDANATLTADIPMEGQTWTGIGTAEHLFTGTFDGANHKISNLAGPLFAITGSGVKIQNLTLEGAITASANSTAAFIAKHTGTRINLSNLVNKTAVTSTADHVGAFIGYAVLGSTTENCIENCINEAIISGKDNVGAIIGYQNFRSDDECLTIVDCGNKGAISGANCVGGLIGLSRAMINYTGSWNEGVITGTSEATGGLLGRSRQGWQYFRFCHNSGKVTGAKYVGGLFGDYYCYSTENTIFYTNFEDSYNEGTVSGTGKNIGGLLGRAEVTTTSPFVFTRCYNTGDIYGPKAYRPRALHHWTNATVTITDCWNIGEVHCTDGDFSESNVYTMTYLSEISRLTLTNSYDLANVAMAPTYGRPAGYEDEWLTNGHFCYFMNGDQSSIVWKQTLGTDANPVLDSSRGTVYKTVTSGTNNYYANSTSGFVLPSMTLTDAQDFTATGDFTATSLTYNRTLAAGGYHSLCLPFAIEESDLPSGSKLFTLSAVGQDAVTLNEVDEVAAGTPCFASVTEPFTFGEMSNVAMVASVTNGTNLKGTFTEITGDGAVGVYKLSGDGTYFAQTAAKDDEQGISAPVIKPFRSYIAAPAGVKTLNILLSDGTSLTPTLSEEKEAVIYDLAGRRVTKATKGIYIVNGKKVMK